jgi:hypothetical protein
MFGDTFEAEQPCRRQGIVSQYQLSSAAEQEQGSSLKE